MGPLTYEVAVPSFLNLGSTFISKSQLSAFWETVVSLTASTLGQGQGNGGPAACIQPAAS